MTAHVGLGDHRGPSVGLFGRTYPIQLPRWGDPRLLVAAVIISVQVLGQTALGFDLSIAQILIALGVAGGLDLVLTAWEQGVIAWPASALLTGNGVALIMRVPGTEHGDWWSTRGWPIFAATAAVAVLSKYVTRVGGRPLLNPSNAALVVAFLVFGSNLADPQDLWWGPVSPGLALWMAPVVVGMVLAIPTVWISSARTPGRWLRRHRILCIPEELDPPPVLRRAAELRAAAAAAQA